MDCPSSGVFKNAVEASTFFKYYSSMTTTAFCKCKAIVLMGLLVFSGFSLTFAQEQRLETFQANFASANLQTKLEVLRAAESEDPAFFGPLYLQALQYVVSNSAQLPQEPNLREVALVAVNRVEAGNYVPAAGELWRLFQDYNESTARIRILTVLGGIAGEVPQVIAGLNDWVRRQHIQYASGGRPDLQVVSAALRAIRQLQSPTSFNILVDTILLQYPELITSVAREAIESLPGDLREMAFAFILARPLAERRPALLFFIGGDILNEQDKLLLAQETLGDILGRTTRDLLELEEFRQIRYAAAAVLREGAFGDATATVIRHFNETVLDFERGRISSGPLLEAIATLGAMGTEGAAQRLTQYLRLVNTYSETDRPYNTQIVLAVIQNLELLRFPVAYDALFYTTLIENYPRRVRDAAREATRSVLQ